MSDQLREQIEGLRKSPDFLTWNAALEAVLALLAERGATTREPDGRDAEWMRRELRTCRDMLADEYWLWQGDGKDHLESLVCPVVIRPEVLANLLAPQGATGTAQPIAATLEEQTISGDGSAVVFFDLPQNAETLVGGPYFVRWGEDGYLHASPVEPRPRGVPDVQCPNCGAWCRLDEHFCGSRREGGDTLTPETPPETARGCGICGGQMVEIRGRHPGDERRTVCPTCLADRLDEVRSIASPEYGVAYVARPPLVGEEAP